MVEARKKVEIHTLEDVRIMFRNFSGKAGEFNPAGRRKFCVLLPEADERKFRDLGWPVKYLDPREEGDLPKPYLEVIVSYTGGRPPTICLITDRGKNNLDESDIGLLDWADIVKVDMSVVPYNYDVRGTKGIKPYLRAIYVTIQEDELERKYAEYATEGSAANMDFQY